MAKKWVLDTETKGTGAQMVPLAELLERRRKRATDPVFVLREPAGPRPAPPAPEPRAPHRFKVVDIVTREVLAEDADTRATADLLRTVRSVVDVNVSVWEPKPRKWRLLTLGEQKALWQLSRHSTDDGR